MFFGYLSRSAISFKKSRRELSIDAAEHKSMLKNNQNTHLPRFNFIPKTGIAFPKRGFRFYCAVLTRSTLQI